jgi:hypothetical protein
MAEETKVDNMPAGAGTQEAPKPEAKQETKTELTFREKMLGDKIKHKEPPKEPPKDPDAKIEDDPAALAKNQALNGDANPENADEHKRKTAKDRIQELAREKNAHKADAELKAKEIERLQAELARIKGTPDENKSEKDKYKEVYIEEKLVEHQNQVRAELHDYVAQHQNPEMFVANYDYYMPLLAKNDEWTVKQIAKHPEKIAMFDKFFEAMTKGVFTIQQWIEAPQPLKMQKIIDLKNSLTAPAEPQKPDAKTETKPEETKKEIPDSIVPDKQAGYNPENKEYKKGEAFRKAWEKGRTK